MFQTKIAEKIKTRFIFNHFFSPENRAPYENVKKCGRVGQATDGNVIWRMRFACWITKTSDTHPEYVIIIIIAFPLLQWLHKRSPMLSYTYIACLGMLYTCTCILQLLLLLLLIVYVVVLNWNLLQL
jgi:hypothetical protein